MKPIIHLSILILLVTSAFGFLWSFAAWTPSVTAENFDYSFDTVCQDIKRHTSLFLHYKSCLDLMPPAYGLVPNAPNQLDEASQIFFLNSYTTIPVGSWPQVLALSDLTGNAQTDAAIATGSYFDPTNDQQLHLFAGVPLTRSQHLTAGADPEAIVTADLNADGLTDIALALAGDHILALYTQPLGLSGPLTYSLPGGPNALATGDFNGDLHSDLAAIAPLSATIHLWKSAPQGLTPLLFNLSYPTGGYDALATGDLDNDGDDDLVAMRGAGYTTDAVLVYLQQNNFFPTSYTLSPETGGYLPHSMTVGDVNSDGRDDVIVTAGGNTPDAYLNIFLQEASGLATIPITYTAHHLPSAVAIGDLNHDGRDDVIVLHDAWRTLSVYTQTVSGTLSAYATAEIPYSDRYRPNALALADLDGNGGLDVALVDRDHGLVILTNTLTAPSAIINQPPEASVLLPGPSSVEGTASPQAITVEVRLRGYGDWMTTTLAGGNWQISLTLPSEERAWWIEARATDAQGHVQAPPARHRVAVEDGPPRGQIIIDDGAYATNQITVALTLPAYDVGGVEAMRFSSDGIYFSDWVTYSFTYSWTLDPGDGLKTLYVQFRDMNANLSDLASDTIILDTIPPTSAVATLPPTISHYLVTPTWSGQDSGSGIAVYDVQMREDMGNWTILLQSTTLTQTTVQVWGDHTYCFRSRATDRAGNIEDWPEGDGDTCVSVIAASGTELRPETAYNIGNPGETVTHTLYVQNLGNVADSYDLSLGAYVWPTSLSANTVGPLNPLAMASVKVYVTIPTGATEGEQDIVSLTATSQEDPSAQDTSSLTTAATFRPIVRGVQLAPPSASQTNNPGKTVTYTLYVKNAGSVTDSYNLSPGAYLWPTNLSVCQTGPIAPGALRSLEIYVTIPKNAEEGEADTVNVIAASQGDVSIYDISTLQTMANTQAIVRGVEIAPPIVTDEGAAGSIVHYVLVVTNTGSLSDTVSLTSYGNIWDTQINPNKISLLSMAHTTITISVSVPTEAAESDSDTVIVLATAIGASNSSVLTTVAIAPTFYIYLPVVMKNN